jgi:outer membrane receptor protein involved in Fe transport
MKIMKSLGFGVAALASPLGLSMLALPATGLVSISSWSQEVAEIVVTTRRREENLQDIPVAVSSFSADEIEKQGISSTADVVKLVPGVQFDQGFSAADTRISIRGINSERGRTSAAVLVDGIDVSGENVTAGGGSSLLNTRLMDLERVEVVKGPQSALYGRNAFAGAISYITRQPSMTGMEAKLSADIADYSTYDVRAAVSGPVIADKLAIGVNLGWYESDGYYSNHNTAVPAANGDLNGGDSHGARLVAVFLPTDSLKITGSVSYSETDSDPRAVAKVGNANTFYLMGQQLPAGTPADFSFMGTMDYGQWLGTVGSVNESDVALSVSERTGMAFAGSTDETLLSYLKLDWDLGTTIFKSTTSYLSNDATLDEDVEYQDGTGTVFMGVGLSLANEYRDSTDTDYFNQEFTIESKDEGRWNWLAGISGFWEDTHNVDESTGWFNDPNIVFVPGFCGSNPFQFACSYAASAVAGTPAKTIDRDTFSWSAFGLVGFDITDQLRLTVEARYIDDEIEVSTNTSIDRVSQYIFNLPIDFSFGAPPTLPATDTVNSDTINPRVALDYKITDDVMVYGSVAKGTKPAGFGTSQFATPQNARVDQEKLWAYELGTKTAWLDGSLQANVAIFFNDYTDRQVGVTVTDPNTGWAAAGIVNAAEAETKGVELELVWRATEALTLGAGYAYTDAEWTDFNYSEIRANSGGVNEKDMAICGNAQGDCSGADIAGIPENALILQANYTRQLAGDMSWYLNAAGQYQDERALYDRVNTAYVDSFWNVDAQLGIQTDQWLVELYATNLFDDDTVRWAQGYQDFRDGMYGGSFGGEPRDETIFAWLPPPRVIGLRASYKFGGE